MHLWLSELSLRRKLAVILVAGIGLAVAICFSVFAPVGTPVRGEALAGDGPAAMGALRAREKNPDDVSGARVPLAEDHPVNREIALAYLDELGCETTLACNGREAVVATRAERYDTALMDRRIQKIDGHAVAAMRESERQYDQKPVPIVVLMAHVSQDGCARCQACGKIGHIAKPCRREALPAGIEVAMKSVGRHPVAAAPGIERGKHMTKKAESPALVSPGDVPVLDSSVLRSIPGIGNGAPSPLLERLSTLFVSEGRRQIEQLEQAIGNGDAETVRQAAHRLKSSSGAIGARRIAECAQRIEQDAREGRLSDDGEALRILRQELQLAEASLAALRDETPA